MTDKDHLKPNGTCYRIKNVKAGPDFMPCGNANLLGTHFACCNHGDKCLSSNACFHAKTGTTYIAGCTDPTYSHPSCPQKLYFQDQPWLGLVRCGKSNDVHKKEEEWAGCEEPDDLSLDEAPANCDCDGKGALFRDAPILEDIAQLPKKTTGTITYFGDHTPTMPVTSSSSSSSPSSTSEARPPSTTESSMLTDASTTATSPPFIATSSVTPPDSPVITVGAKAGVGIGSALGALLIGCMVFMALSLRKRKKKRQQQAQDSQEGSPAAGQGQISSANTDVPLVSPAMSGFKSELSADEPNSARSYLESPSPVSPQYPPYPPPHQGEFQRHEHPSQSWGPQWRGRSSAVSDLSAATTVYGSMPNSPQHPEGRQQPSTLPPISELQG